MEWLPAALAFALVGVAPAPGSGGPAPDPAAALLRALHEAEQALAAGEIEVAESRYRTALAEGWILSGLVEEAEGRDELAAKAFAAAASSTVSQRRASTLLALARLRLGEAGEAVALLREVLARHPDDRPARSALAQALVAAGRTAEAVQELEEAHARAPEDAETTFNLASGYLRLGEVGKAETLFARLAAERPGAPTQVLIGRTYRDFHHFDRARTALVSALALDPKAPRAHYYLGTVELLATGRDGLELAREHFERELERAPEDPSTNLYYGVALAEGRRFEAAVGVLTVAARWPPARFDALRFAGRCLFALDRVAEAVAALREALELGAANGAPERQLASTHYQLGTALRRAGDLAGAEEQFALAKHRSAGQVEDERERFASFLGEELTGAEGPERSTLSREAERLAGLAPAERQALRQALRGKVATELARASVNLGVLATRAGRARRAGEWFAQARKLDAAFPGLDALLGAAHFNAGQFGEATESLSRALAAEPSRADLRRMLALARLNLEDYPRAAALLADDPERQTNPSLQYAYGLALVRAGRAAEAEPVFDRLLATHADWPQLHVLLGQAYAQEGDWEAAVRALGRALELDPRVPEANATLGGIYLRQGRLAEAETALTGELEVAPGDLRTRYHLATVLELRGRPEEARPLVEAVLADDPDFADARYLLGKILLGQGKADEAAAQLEAAARQAPEDAAIHYQLAQAYQRLGRTELAGREFEIYRGLKAAGRGDGS